MPLFTDVHVEQSEDAPFDDVAGAHEADVKIESQFGVKYMRYWVDEASSKVFCPAETPDAETAAAAHREAYGLFATRVHEVREGS